MPDGYLDAFLLGLTISVIAIYLGSIIPIVDFALNPFKWSDEDHWR